MGRLAAVAGASGYAGGELLRILLDHPALEIGPITAATSAGTPVTSVHPHLLRLGDQRFAPTEPEILAKADVVFLALPHGASASLAAALPPDLPIVDLGADHRLADAAAWARFYDTPYAGTWTYGLPELPGARARIRGATRVANPGCYPVAAVLGLAPLLAAELVEPDDLVVVAASGTSGAGRSPKPHLLATEVIGQMSAYGVGGTHRHTPEIVQELTAAAGQPVSLSFTPTLAPMPRGILAVATARLAPKASDRVLREALRDAYDHEPFVHLLPAGSWPATGAVLGSNAAHLQVAADHAAGRALVVTAIDNLVKGAAGQAVQNANLMLGLDETAGLSCQGVAP